MPSLFFCILLLGLRVTESQASGLVPPQQVRLDADKETQTLSVTWEDGHASTFDVEILRTELMEMVLNETVGVTEDQSTGKHQWNWTSPVPLECTSLSVKVRSRDGQDVSEWSSQQILPGLDLPDNTDSQMYPEQGDNAEDLERFVSSLLEEPEVSVIGAGRGPAGSIIHKLFVSAQRAALLAPLDEDTGRGGGADDKKPMGGASVPDFPPPAGREILLRTCVPRPAPYSKALPQRLFCVLMREDFRLAGAFSSDTSFF